MGWQSQTLLHEDIIPRTRFLSGLLLAYFCWLSGSFGRVSVQRCFRTVVSRRTVRSSLGAQLAEPRTSSIEPTALISQALCLTIPVSSQ